MDRRTDISKFNNLSSCCLKECLFVLYVSVCLSMNVICVVGMYVLCCVCVNVCVYLSMNLIVRGCDCAWVWYVCKYMCCMSVTVFLCVFCVKCWTTKKNLNCF